MKNLKPIPNFKNLDEEAKFWDNNDSTEYVDWADSKETIFPNLKLSTKSISLRLPGSLLARIKVLANEKDVPYQSLMKVYLSERVSQERKLLKTK
jgi:predicted DNA binding CopG/RHH family protein